MTYQKPVVYLMADVVTAMSAKVLPVIQEAQPAIVQINYQFGHLKELIATMQEWEKAPSFQPKKYPLVALLMNFNEKMGNSGYVGECTLEIIIAYPTDPLLKADARYTQTFEPILLPIYHGLLQAIESSPAFVTQGVNKIIHNKMDCPYYGKGGLGDTQGNVFADCIDAIDISNLQLKINFSPFSTILK